MIGEDLFKSILNFLKIRLDSPVPAKSVGEVTPSKIFEMLDAGNNNKKKSKRISKNVGQNLTNRFNQLSNEFNLNPEENQKERDINSSSIYSNKKYQKFTTFMNEEELINENPERNFRNFNNFFEKK